MPDLLREALERIRDRHGRVCCCFQTCDHVACRDSFAAREIADEALAASSPPAREWRIVDRFGNARGDCFVYSVHPPAANIAYLAKTFPSDAPFRVETRRIGPWVDAPAEGEGA